MDGLWAGDLQEVYIRVQEIRDTCGNEVDAYGLAIFRMSTLECRRPRTDVGILGKTNLNSTLGSANIPLDRLSFAIPSKTCSARLLRGWS